MQWNVLTSRLRVSNKKGPDQLIQPQLYKMGKALDREVFFAQFFVV